MTPQLLAALMAVALLVAVILLPAIWWVSHTRFTPLWGALFGGFVVFSLIKTRHHSADWLRQFRHHVSAIPEVIDFFRIGGEYDYLLKIVTRDMASYDDVYKRLIADIELETVTSYFAMEAIEEQRPIPLS